MIVKADIFEAPVVHSEAFGNRSQTNKSEALVKVACMGVVCDNRVKLKQSEAGLLSLN